MAESQPISKSDGDDRGDRDQFTSHHARQARSGDLESIEWLVRRFSSLLLVNARYRIGPVLSRHYDAEDIVDEVWAITLPRLSSLSERDGRFTPVLLKFLSTTLIRRCNDLMKKYARERRFVPIGIGTGPGEALAAETTAAISRVVRQERAEAVASAIEALPDRDRELLILRGIEQQPYRAIEAIVGRDHKALAVEYRRALDKLKAKLGGTVIEDLE